MDPANYGEALSLHRVAVIGTGFLGIRIAGKEDGWTKGGVAGET